MVDVTGLSYEPHDLKLPPGDLWVFGYGSLMWNPGFKFSQNRAARLYGYHRSLCVWSWVHRGTQAAPGLVLGLDLGGSCLGAAYRIAARNKAKVADYLYRREMATPVYVPVLRHIRLRGQSANRPVPALTFIVDRRHAQYAGRLSVDEAYFTVAKSRGRSGANPEYVISAVDHFRDLGIRDRWLQELAARLAVSD